ncbi:MAG: winged helix-turn-helix domain-containing protein [Vicinamibacterales bacterium]
MPDCYVFDDFRLDLAAYRLERAGMPVALEPKALDVLALLASRPGRLVTKQEIFAAVWPDTAVTDHALTRVIAQIRRALGDDARESRFVETVPTRGYRWLPPTTVVTAAAVPPVAAAPSDAQASATPAAAPLRDRRLPVAAAVVLLAAVATAWWVLTDERPGRTAQLDTAVMTGALPEQLTTAAGLELQPSVSPDGRAMAYVSATTGHFEIYVRQLDDAGLPTPLTRDGAHNVQPAWSPDGQRIAYHSYARGGVWVVPARGGTPRQVVAAGSHPAWSPDSRRIAYQSDEFTDVTPSAHVAQGGSTIWIVDADGRGAAPLTTASLGGGHGAPAWSPDGRFLVFTVIDGGARSGLWTVEVSSGRTAQLTSGGWAYEAAWLPAGNAVVATGGDPVIWRLGVDPVSGTAVGRARAIAVPGVPGVRGLSVAPDGETVLFTGIALDSQIWSATLGGPAGVAAGAPQPLTNDTSRRNSVPVVSPDGRRVAYMSRRSGSATDISVLSLADGASERVTSDEAFDGQPSWFPDGRRLAFVSNREDRPGIWALDLDTRRHDLLFANDDVTRAPSLGVQPGSVFAEVRFSPSFRQLAFAMLEPAGGQRVVHVVAFDPITSRVVSDPSRSTGYPAWSPDERALAVEIKDGASTQVGIIDLDAGTIRQLTSGRGQSWVRSWSPDGTRVAFAALRDGTWSLRWIDARTGEEGRFLPDEPVTAYVRYPEWSPLGDRLVYERGVLTGNIWRLSLPDDGRSLDR